NQCSSRTWNPRKSVAVTSHPPLICGDSATPSWHAVFEARASPRGSAVHRNSGSSRSRARLRAGAGGRKGGRRRTRVSGTHVHRSAARHRVFSSFLGSAWITRRRPEYHKRFILLAATALVIPGVGHALVQRHAFDGGVGCRSLASNRCLEGLHALARGSTHMKP